MSLPTGEQPGCGLVRKPAPVDTQCIEQRWTQHDVAVLAPLAALDMDDHATAVDVADLQVCHLGAASAGGIERHQQAMKGRQCRIDKPRYLLLAEHLRKTQHLPRIRRLESAPDLLQYLDIEKAQRTQPLVHGVRSQLPLREHRRLVLADMLRTELVRGTTEVPSEVLDGTDVATNRARSVVASLQFLKHDLT